MIVEVHVIALSYQILGWSIINCSHEEYKILAAHPIVRQSTLYPKAIQNAKVLIGQLNKILLDLT